MADLNKLIKTRGGIRAVFTRTLNAIDPLKRDSEEFEDVFSQLTRLHDRLESLDNNILDMAEDEFDVETEVETSMKYTAQYDRLKRLAEKNARVGASGRTPATKPNIHLPKIEIPTFDGDALQFTSFIEMFSSTIGEHEGLSGIEKFSYLKTLLKGEAARTIEGLPLVADNYEVAMDILFKRFGDKNRVIGAHVRELLQVPVLTTTKGKGLRTLCDHVQIHVRALETMGVACNEYACFLVQIILSRLPQYLRLQWARHKESDNLDVNELMSFLDNEAKAQESSSNVDCNSNCNTPAGAHAKPKANYAIANHSRTNWQTEFKSKASHGSTNHSRAKQHTDTKSSGRDVACFCCMKDHYLSKCEKFQSMPVEEKRSFIKDKGLCFRCFGKHYILECEKSWTCRYCKSSSHHSQLHIEKRATNEADADNKEIHKPSSPKSHGIVNTSVSHTQHYSIMPTLSAHVKGSTCTRKLRFLLDTASQSTFLKKGVSDLFQTNVIGRCDMTVSGFGKSRVTLHDCPKVSLTLVSGDKEVSIEAYESEEVSEDVEGVMLDDYFGSLIHGLELADDYEELERPIDGIIGTDQCCKIVTDIISLDPDLIGIGTIFGYCICGRVPQSLLQSCTNFSRSNTTAMVDLKNLWELEKVGICESEDTGKATKIQIVANTGEDGRYVVSWPIRDSSVLTKLDSYESQARERFDKTLSRLKKDEFLFDQYQAIMTGYLDKGYIEKIPEQELEPNHAVRYLPHHPVITTKESRKKVRIVFDASAMDQNKLSLNDVMEKGPNLNPECIEVLIRFRMRQVALTCDIREAFLQIRLAEKDKDLVRFFWLSDNDKNGEIVAYRMKRVIFGVTASPYILASVLRTHFEHSCGPNQALSRQLDRNFYVDDFIISVDTRMECQYLAETVRKIIADMKASLGKWNSNSPEIERQFEAENDKGNLSTSVLGINWDKSEDILAIKGDFSRPIPNTKRQLLQRLASIYDPLGFVSPYLVVGKLLLQESWREDLGWDEQFNEKWTRRVEAWWSQAEKIPSLKFNRCLHISNSTDLTLIGFSDASDKAMGAAVYSRIQDPEGRIDVSLVMSKSRLAPIKQISTPRKELTAALLCARLVAYIKNAMGIEAEVLFFTDSQVALGWIRGDSKRWKQYVQARVDEIQALTDPGSWNYVPGKSNPADIVSRGITDISYFESDKWLCGPNEMRETDRPWWPQPCITNSKDLVEQCAEEKRKKCVSVSVLSTDIDNSYIRRYSQYSKCVRITAWLFRFIRRCKREDLEPGANLSCQELRNAEQRLIKLDQLKHFEEEITCLQNNERLQPSSRISQLKPFLDQNGTLRKGGRLEYSSLSFEEKFPAILSNSSHLTYLMVQETHEKLAHASVRDTMMKIRDKYWILKCRSTIRSCLHECRLCRRKRALPYLPDFPPLPSDRVDEMNFLPYNSTGVDYAGPFKIKDKGTLGKCYFLLFTCSRIRAVHIECVRSMDLPTFIRSFEMFAARRGCPQVIRSDNFKTFQAAAPVLAKRYLVDWKFNAPLAPWQGGFFERMIRSVKTSLRVFMRNRTLSFEDLRHRLTIIENAVNSRPISAFYDGVDDPKPLSPNDFLLHRGLQISGNASSSSIQIRECFLASIKYYKFIWTRWRAEYLRMLHSERKKKNFLTPKVGDVVMIENDNNSKSTWPLAVITETIPGNDGRVRTVKIKMNNKLYTRPVQRLYYLEL